MNKETRNKYLRGDCTCPYCGQVGGEVTPALNDSESDKRPIFKNNEIYVYQSCRACGNEWIIAYARTNIFPWGDSLERLSKEAREFKSNGLPAGMVKE